MATLTDQQLSVVVVNMIPMPEKQVQRLKSISCMTTETLSTAGDDTLYHSDEEEHAVITEKSINNKNKLSARIPVDLDSTDVLELEDEEDDDSDGDDLCDDEEKKEDLVSDSEPSSHVPVAEKISVPVQQECFKEEEKEEITEETSSSQASKPSRSPQQRKKSILKPCDYEIPIKNRGWKNLPKAVINPVKTQASNQVSNRYTDYDVDDYHERGVRFGTIEVRCYDQCIGDNPSVSYGTPISLDWEYEEYEAIELDIYETTRNQRRTLRNMMMNYYNRRNLLMYTYGYTEQQIDQAEKAASKIRNQRAITKALLPAAKMEDFLSSAARKTKRAFGNKNKKQRGTDQACV